MLATTSVHNAEPQKQGVLSGPLFGADPSVILQVGAVSLQMHEFDSEHAVLDIKLGLKYASLV